jgi:aspartyl-tRNA(Asn)/glutamyl-tRNA(Gln) amidotransferase subunit C
MMIDNKEIRKIADLARLELSAEEETGMAEQLNTILTYIDVLTTVETSAIEPTVFVTPDHDPMRDDTIKPSLPVDELTANGPAVKRNHFAIPKVIG